MECSTGLRLHWCFIKLKQEQLREKAGQPQNPPISSDRLRFSVNLHQSFCGQWWPGLGFAKHGSCRVHRPSFSPSDYMHNMLQTLNLVGWEVWGPWKKVNGFHKDPPSPHKEIAYPQRAFPYTPFSVRLSDFTSEQSPSSFLPCRPLAVSLPLVGRFMKYTRLLRQRLSPDPVELMSGCFQRCPHRVISSCW